MGDLGAGCAELVDAGLDGGADFGVEAFGEVLGRNAELHAVDALVDVCGVVGDGEGEEVASMTSWPAMTPRTVAASRTVAAKGPMRSSDEAKAMRP